MINSKFVRFTLVVYVTHKVNVLVTDIIINITIQEHLIFTSLHIGSRLFELFSKEVRVKKQPGMPLRERVAKTRLRKTGVNCLISDCSFQMFHTFSFYLLPIHANSF